MENKLNYIDVNRNSWNSKTEVHLNSDFYNLEDFKKGKSSLNAIELELLGEVNGKSILHLQCHFGLDSMSLSCLGAEVTGIDLSDKAIDHATSIAEELQLTTRFICSDVYNLPKHLNEKFDIVYTSYGTIGWLPDLSKWTEIISHFLKPAGKFVFVEFHPFVWMYDDDFKYVKYNYFKSDPIIETESGTYADRNSRISQQNVTWNHSLSDVLSSLIKQGLTIQSFQEYNYSPYNCFNNTYEFEAGKFRIKTFEDKIPMLYALVAANNKF